MRTLHLPILKILNLIGIILLIGIFVMYFIVRITFEHNNLEELLRKWRLIKYTCFFIYVSGLNLSIRYIKDIHLTNFINMILFIGFLFVLIAESYYFRADN